MALPPRPAIERPEWLHNAADRCTASPPARLPPTLPALAAFAPSPGMEAILLVRSLPGLPWPGPRAPAAAARSSEVRVGVGMTWLALRLTGGLALPLRLARSGLVAPEAVRLGRLLAGRLLYAVLKLADSVLCTAGIKSCRQRREGVACWTSISPGKGHSKNAWQVHWPHTCHLALCHTCLQFSAGTCKRKGPSKPHRLAVAAALHSLAILSATPIALVAGSGWGSSFWPDKRA